ncbi:MAG: PQQ-dependent sugar dehydrogenase [Hyphomonadaceae bacterium]|nr:PQQ-dependent sugar dehydrogenase [Hyphomonadaceae bacterium]
MTSSIRVSLLLAGAALAACTNAPTVSADAAAPASGRPPVETRAPDGQGQTPAFPGQTRAPQPETLSAVTATTVVTGIEKPWAVEVLPDGRMLVTEKAGRLRVVTADGRVLPPVAGVPAVDTRSQGGLLDVAVKPADGGAMTLCLSYAEPRGGSKAATAVSCGRATGAEAITLSGMRVIFRQEPAWDSTGHYGSRIVFTGDDTLFITTGERQNPDARVNAQNVNSTIGKVVRLKLDGSIPADNPFAAQGGPAAQVWSLGHRNIQSAALRANGDLWTVEHGAKGGDELNKPLAGKNYGWPVITYGIDYNGRPIGEGLTAGEGFEQPAYYWDPVIAPSGMVFHSGKMFNGWRDSALIGGLASRSVTRLVFEGDRVVAEERISIDGRVRDVTEGPDGAVYLAIDDADGRIVKLTPR